MFGLLASMYHTYVVHSNVIGWGHSRRNAARGERLLAAILTPLGVNGENIRKVGEIENSFSCKPQCILLSAATRQRGGRQATFPVPQSQEKKSGGNFSTWGGGTEKMGKSREIRVECKNFPGENERVTWPQRKLLSSYPHPKKSSPISRGTSR